MYRAVYDLGISQSDFLRLAVKNYLCTMDLIKKKSKEQSRKREISRQKLGVCVSIGGEYANKG